jgi:hypothetical protein
MDIKLLHFLIGVLQDIHIIQLEGFVTSINETKVCYLIKFFYELKQAPHVWYELCDSYFLSQGFLKCLFDRNVHLNISSTKPS